MANALQKLLSPKSSDQMQVPDFRNESAQLLHLVERINDLSARLDQETESRLQAQQAGERALFQSALEQRKLADRLALAEGERAQMAAQLEELEEQLDNAKEERTALSTRADAQVKEIEALKEKIKAIDLQKESLQKQIEVYTDHYKKISLRLEAEATERKVHADQLQLEKDRVQSLETDVQTLNRQKHELVQKAQQEKRRQLELRLYSLQRELTLVEAAGLESGKKIALTSAGAGLATGMFIAWPLYMLGTAVGFMGRTALEAPDPAEQAQKQLLLRREIEEIKIELGYI